MKPPARSLKAVSIHALNKKQILIFPVSSIHLTKWPMPCKRVSNEKFVSRQTSVTSCGLQSLHWLQLLRYLTPDEPICPIVPSKLLTSSYRKFDVLIRWFWTYWSCRDLMSEYQISTAKRSTSYRSFAVSHLVMELTIFASKYEKDQTVFSRSTNVDLKGSWPTSSRTLVCTVEASPE